MPSACLRLAVAIGVSFADGARPMLLHAPLVIDALLLGQAARQRFARHGGAFEFDEADKNAGRFARGQVVDQPSPLSRLRGCKQTSEGENASKYRRTNGKRFYHS